jgi:SHS2 domain-containing protein
VTNDAQAPLPFEVLEHIADVGLRAYGRTQAELFANAASGLTALALGGGATEQPAISESARLPLAATAPDLEQLLVNWLSEILYRMDAEGWAFSKFHVEHCDATAVAGEGWGERRDAANRTRSVAVKAVTYHQLSVRQMADGWQATVYFDI